jgi:anthranilate phosphoribosyltransferase
MLQGLKPVAGTVIEEATDLSHRGGGKDLKAGGDRQLTEEAMIREAIEAVVAGRSLSTEEAARAMGEIMSGEATPAQLGAFLTALRLKGETVDEVAGMAQVMRERSLHVHVEGPLVDTCGTGGDASGTFNISTTAGFVVAGAGVKVAKHGNRAMSGACGSADVLEALGVKIDLGPEGVQRCLEEVGFGFMFAQKFHPSMRFAAGPRREIGIRTVFNILGPLTNPAGAKAQLIGVADPSVAEMIANVLGKLGSSHALIVHGADGLDELTLGDATQVWELKDGAVSAYTVTPEELGFDRVRRVDLRVGSAEESAKVLREVLQGSAGPAPNVVLVNAAAALLAADRVTTLREGVAVAAESVQGGGAERKLDALVELSQRLE